MNIKSYDIAHVTKHQYLAEIANAMIDWNKIITEIERDIDISRKNNKIEKNNEGQDTGSDTDDDRDFDLNKLLELNQINIKEANNIEQTELQKIRVKLRDEVHEKLALELNPRLSGAITWVACVISWYKLQWEVQSKFERKLTKFKQQKQYFLQEFRGIVNGDAEVSTIKGARSLFKDALAEFYRESDFTLRKDMLDFLKTEEIKDVFDTSKVYKRVDTKHLPVDVAQLAATKYAD